MVCNPWNLSVACSYESYAAQARLPLIQGTGGVYFAGAWASYGFHEDGIKAGVAVARLLGAEVPWGAGIATSPKMGLTDMLWLGLFDRCAAQQRCFQHAELYPQPALQDGCTCSVLLRALPCWLLAWLAVARLLGAEVPWGASIATSLTMGLTDMLWLGLF
jgi:hypothetical protein